VFWLRLKSLPGRDLAQHQVPGAFSFLGFWLQLVQERKARTQELSEAADLGEPAPAVGPERELSKQLNPLSGRVQVRKGLTPEQ
jgi:hypothetical protein